MKSNQSVIEKPKYQLEIIWSPADQCYVVVVPELPGCSTHGETIQEAVENAMEAIQGYIESLRKRKLPVPTPLSEKKFSGKIPLRITSHLHRDLTVRAGIEGMSLNQFIAEKLKKAV